MTLRSLRHPVVALPGAVACSAVTLAVLNLLLSG